MSDRALKVVIDRSKWDIPRNRGARTGQLLTSDGLRCCLGFVGGAAGIPDADMLGVAMPRMTEGDWPAELFMNIRKCSSKELMADPGWKILTTDDAASGKLATNTSRACDLLAKVNDCFVGSDLKTDDEKELLIIELGIKAGIEFQFEGDYAL